MEAVSFVLPVYNGERFLGEVIAAILREGEGRTMELIAVDDRSSDGSRALLDRLAAADARIRVIDGPGRGAAAAMNCGVAQARHPIVCQVDQDVLVGPGWLGALCEAMRDPAVGAAQAWYETDPRASLWARAAGRELEWRYSNITSPYVDHVCTGNTAYRREALLKVDGFDETFGYGYDNDLSYRLSAAGYKLAFVPAARSIHFWREDLIGYVRQQYGQGYGRLDIVDKHRQRYTGDDVSRFWMMAHAPLTLVSMGLFALAGLLALVGGPAIFPVLLAVALLALLAGERLWVGVLAMRRFRDPVGLAFPPVHLIRDLSWSVAIVTWMLRRLLKRPRQPTDSMKRLRA